MSRAVYSQMMTDYSDLKNSVNARLNIPGFYFEGHATELIEEACVVEWTNRFFTSAWTQYKTVILNEKMFPIKVLEYERIQQVLDLDKMDREWVFE